MFSNNFYETPPDAGFHISGKKRINNRNQSIQVVYLSPELHVDERIVERIDSNISLLFDISFPANGIAIIEIIGRARPLSHIIVYWVKSQISFDGCHRNGRFNLGK